MNVIKGIFSILFILIIMFAVAVPLSSAENSTIINQSLSPRIVNAHLLNSTNSTNTVTPPSTIIIRQLPAQNTSSTIDPALKLITPQTTEEKTGNVRRAVISDAATGAGYVSNEIIVRYKTNKSQNSRFVPAYSVVSNSKTNAEVQRDFNNSDLPGMEVIKLPSNVSVDDAITEYQKNPDILYAQPNYVYHTASLIPNDPGFNSQWGLHNLGNHGADIDAPDAWSISTGSNTVVVAVIDSGVDYNHPDLSSNIWVNTDEIPGNGIDDDNNGYIDDVHGWNFFNNTSDPMDGNTNNNIYHGTHVSGILGAVGNNSIGVTGVNWNVTIMPLRTTDEKGSSYTSTNVEAIYYASANGVNVISNSWGGDGYDQLLKDAIDNSPAVVVCAAGNNNRNTDSVLFYPASFTSQNIISVAATDSSDNMASFSNYGQNTVDLAAPGVHINSTMKDSGYQYLSGTSMATPHVSGVAALIKSVNPQLTNIQIKDIILNNVDVIPSLSGNVSTGGRLNAYKAVLAAQSTLVIPVANFTGSPRTGAAPLTVSFTDLSTNATGWNWTFGDGNITNSTDQNPVHTYLDSGVYNVSLNVTNSQGLSNVTKNDYIVVTKFPTAKIGVYQNGVWYLDNNGNGTWDGVLIDKNYKFGGPGNVSVVGDWNGDGRDKIGVTNSVYWYLDYNGNGTWDGPVVDRAPYFGIAGYKPVAGDWNGDRKTKVGVYNDGTWYLDYNGNGTWDGPVNDKAYLFGGPGNVSVVGDWNGDGLTEIGVTNSVYWYLDYNGNGTWDGPVIDRAPYFGIAGYTPVVGDWNGDGKTEVGVTNDVYWYLDYNGNGTWDGPVADRAPYFGIAGYKPVVGDWNGDGKTEVGVTNDVYWYLDSNGNGVWDGPVIDKAPYFGINGWAPLIGKWN